MPLTFELRALRFSSLGFSNLNEVRGQLGKALRKRSPEEYRRFFAPVANGPSGLHDPPRPFVLRPNGINLFDTSAAACTAFEAAIGADAVEGRETLRLEFSPRPAKRIRIRFLTATELKGADRPEFGVLLCRIRDRISTLRALYGPGPLEIDFKAFGDHASRVSMTRCEIEPVKDERVSKGTGQRHSLGGFIGSAEYEGDLGEFVPYLEIARWTGVGRQTVWGKGEIAVETF